MKWKKTEQGYLVTTAQITRTGAFEYYGHELGMMGSDANKKVNIYRTEDELFSPETMSSFEGVPITLLHPEDHFIDAETWDEKQPVGHVQNGRREGKFLVYDAYINDAAAIKTIEKLGIREVSCGYEPPELVQRGEEIHHINIRGNHVAIVPEGRGGSAVRLNDKKGKVMKKFSLKDVVSLLKGKRPNDAEGQSLTEDEINSMISALESALAELEGKEGADSTVADLTAQIEELKAQLEAMKAANPVDADGEGDDKDVKIAELEAENAELKAKVASLEEELAVLKGEQETASTLNDAKARFPKFNFNDAKSAREVKERVLVNLGAFNDAQAKALTNEEVKAAYAAAKMTVKPRSTIGDRLFNDAAPQPKKSATQRLGGK